VAIGASTGGPHAIRNILAELPPAFTVPIVVVQHTTSGYIGSLVEWLGAQTRLPVRVAAEGDAFHAGGVWLAPTDQHLVVRGRQLALLDTPPCSLHRPSATVLFRSVAATYGPRAVGILLTGMGEDGALGLREMRQAGALTIAQDEASSVVFGMPAEAIRLSAACKVLPPSEIARLLREQAAIGQGKAA
jgi:two-component system chemotaxis response regulator CheB